MAFDAAIDKSLNQENGFLYPQEELRDRVRLVRLSSSGPGGSFAYSWEIVPLENLHCTRYRALSYTWGLASTRDDLRTIEIEGQTFYIRRNLHDFLAAAAQRQTSGLIFIDAICINQVDCAERQSQVRYMAQVYRCATEVIAWLGEPNAQSREGVEALSHAKTKDVPSWSKAQLVGYRYLCNHRYWSRIWIVQEVLLATTMVVWCGSFSFPLGLFGSSAKEKPIISFYTHLSQGNTDYDTSRHRSPAEAVITHRIRTVIRPNRDYMAQGTQVMSLEEMTASLRKPYSKVETFQSQTPDRVYEVIHKFGHLKCSDPRDKLYGFLGILDARSKAQINADYSKGPDYAFYQALKIGLQELCPSLDSPLDNSWDSTGRGWLSRYYAHAQSAFGISDEASAKILKQVLSETRLPAWLREMEFARQWQEQFGWTPAQVACFRDFQLVNEKATEPDSKRIEGGKLFSFHQRQHQAAIRIFTKLRLPVRLKSTLEGF